MKKYIHRMNILGILLLVVVGVAACKLFRESNRNASFAFQGIKVVREDFVTQYNTPIKIAVEIGAFKPDPLKINIQNYPPNVEKKHKDCVLWLLKKDVIKIGDIISVDGLKYRIAVDSSNKSIILAVINPPLPVYEPDKESAIDHLIEYTMAINVQHPNLDFPPLPPLSPKDISIYEAKHGKIK